VDEFLILFFHVKLIFFLGSLPGLGFLLLTLLCCTEAAHAKNGQSLMTWLRSMRAKR
jgi:hypothetical protein